jgi:hypothetical protein
MVYVISKSGKPLMPCANVIARLLLKSKRARVYHKLPFTIKLLYDTTEFTQPLTLGVDTGSKTIGTAVVNNKGDVIYSSEVEVRNDISKKMETRAMHRRNRRNRKTRYRKVRFCNRRNSIRKDRFSPTMTSKINSHLKEIKFIKSILPITEVILETGSFDVAALNNPAVLTNPKLYQQGPNYGFENTKAMVLCRDNHCCQKCNNKNIRLEVHHIIWRSRGGSDNSDNLLTLCKFCHDAVHADKLLIKGGKHKGILKYATQMSSIRIQLLKRVSDAKETFGYITKVNRQMLGLGKEHHIDAAVIASKGRKVNLDKIKLIQKKCVSKGDYKQTFGSRSEKKIPTGKIKGFRKFDKIRYKGKEYFIKSRMSTGYIIPMDIKGNEMKIKPMLKFTNVKRIAARKSWLNKI